MGSNVKVNFGVLSIKPCGNNTDRSFYSITFKLHMQVVDDERRNPIDFGSWGQNVEVKFGTLCIKPCWHDTDCSFSPITFEEEPYLFHVTGLEVNFETLLVKLYEHDTGYSFYPITFKLNTVSCR